MNFRLFFNCGANINDVQVTSGNKPQPRDTVVLNGQVMRQLKIGKKIEKNSFSDLITVSANSGSLDSERRNPSPSIDIDDASLGLMSCAPANPMDIPIASPFDDSTIPQFTNDSTPKTTPPREHTPPYATKKSIYYTSSDLKPVLVYKLNADMLRILQRQHNTNEKKRMMLEATNDNDSFKLADDAGCTF